MSSSSSRRGSWAWRPAPAWWAFGLCALLLVASPARLPALTESELGPTPLLRTLREADASLTELEQLWPKLSERLSESAAQLEQARTQLDSLRAELTLWRESSSEWEQVSEDSQAALRTAQSSLDELTRRYDGLWSSWQKYQQETQEQAVARELAVRRWRTAAICGVLAALAGGFLAGCLAR